MASPQKENGYTAIANEIMDVLAKTCLSGSNRQVLDTVLRKTYGWNKKEDFLSISQLEEATLLSRRAVIYALQNLEAKKIIIITRDSNRTNSIKFNKNYDDWIVQSFALQVLSNRNINRLRSAKLRGNAKLGKKVVQNSVNNVNSFAPTKAIKTKAIKIKRVCFVPPTLKEVGDYIREKGYSVDPKLFYDFFTTGEPKWVDSNGKPVRNWKQKIITWHGRRSKSTSQQSPPIKLDADGLTARQRFLKQQGDEDYLKG